MKGGIHGSPKATHTNGPGSGSTNQMPAVGPGSFAKSVRTDREGYPTPPADGSAPKGLRTQRRGE